MTRGPRSRPGMPGPLVADVWQHLRDRDKLARPAVKTSPIRVVDLDESGIARIDLMEEIGFWGITASEFVDELLAIDATTIELHVNSPGGDVFDGVAIMNALIDHKAAVNVVVDGMAASAASFIAMAGDSVRMNRGSQMMIHDALGFCVGNPADMERMKELLDRISDTIAGIYAERAGGTSEDWRELMTAETWFSATEAVEAGLADEAAAGSKNADPDDDPEPTDTDPEPTDPENAGKDDDEKDEPADVTDRFATAYEKFLYAGRAQAPAPQAPSQQPKFQFDPDVFRAAIREGVNS